MRGESDTVRGESDTVRGESDTGRGESDTGRGESDTGRGEREEVLIKYMVYFLHKFGILVKKLEKLCYAIQ